MSGHVLFWVEIFFRAAFPFVGFLSANPLPGIKASMKIIIRLEVVIGINDKAGCYTVFAEDFGKGDVIFAEGLPFGLWKDASSGVIYPSARDGRQALCRGICE